MAAPAKKLETNPEMLAWAREWRGVPIEVAARAVKQPVDRFRKWETERGDGPTIRQARKLADLYQRSVLEFFRDTKPDIPEPSLVPDFRLIKGDEPLEERGLKIVQMWAEAKRANAIELATQLDEDIPTVPQEVFSNRAEDEEIAAARARAAIGFSLADQIELAADQAYQLPDILRGKLERSGILTIRRSDIRKLRMRGMCVAIFPLPVIVYGSESPAAQVFTIAHELGHIALKQSAISGPMSRDANDIERWCDKFAAAFLMPKGGLVSVVGPAPGQPAENISDEALKTYADRFRVSQHAMLVRLVHLGYVAPDYYWLVKKPEFDEQEKKYKSFGRPKFYGKRYQTKLGDFYTGLVISAWNSGKITNHNAAEYMEIKSFAHLNDVRENFGRS